MKQGMIMGGIQGAARRGKPVVAGYSKNEKTSAGKSRKTTSAAAGQSHNNATKAGTDKSGSYDESVQYDVSEGRSRVAQILSRQRNLYPEETDIYSTDGSQEAAAEATKQSVPENGQTRKGQAEKNTALNTGEAETEEVAEETEESTDTQGYSESDIEYMERLLESMRENRVNASKKTTGTKKKLTYSYRKVSGAIMRAKTRIQAGNALSSAKAELSSLKRKAGSGQYKDEEVQIAINHANKMIRTARKKMSHLKLEEIQKKADRDTVNGKERKNEAVKKQVHAENSTAVKSELDQQVMELKKRLKQITKAEKNGHRRSENYDLLQADMEYLKRKIDLLRQDQSGQENDDNRQNILGTDSSSVMTAGTAIMTDTSGSTGNASAADLAQQGMDARESTGTLV